MAGRYFNSVNITFGPHTSVSKLASLLASRSCIVITSKGSTARGVIDTIRDGLKGRTCNAYGDGVDFDGVFAVYDNAPPNPTIDDVTKAAEVMSEHEADAIIAIGGGSVLDLAKGVATLRSPGIPAGFLYKHLRHGKAFPLNFSPPPIFAIPTTHGTGSEVTMWATVWDTELERKYSLSHPRLYPEHAVIDPTLTVSCPEEVTVSTGLDALSHAMESVWNRNHNPIADALATKVIKVVPDALIHALSHPSCLHTRSTLLNASTLAGMCISGTKTAIAHSISYPLTLAFGLPHGLACSFTLPTVLRRIGQAGSAERIQPILDGLGVSTAEEGSDKLLHLFSRLHVGTHLTKYIPHPGSISKLDAPFLNKDRAGNSMLAMSNDEARQLAATAMEDILKRGE
uniref:Alcohol dehydrogenase iron-type/glycerol dehydrogenase GldA domain-containing protein n=1 Tax=Palpitomonas bilix TaxID=652834 RepID=A0A7S3LWJ8_9EUKA